MSHPKRQKSPSFILFINHDGFSLEKSYHNLLTNIYAPHYVVLNHVLVTAPSAFVYLLTPFSGSSV